ncbi:hypothetical protein, partial [Candidatus Nitrosocosmicus sp. SS]
MTGTYFLIVLFFTLFIGTLTFPINLDRSSSVSSSDIFREVIGTTVNEDESSDNAVNNTSRSEDSLDGDDSSNSDRTGQEIVTNPPDEEVSIPVADAGQDVTVPGQTLTQLDGSKSYFPSDGVDDVQPSLSYAWT